MNWLWLTITLLILTFGFVLAFGPPYLPTRRRFAAAALELLALEPNQTMLELGSGDGRILRQAAQRGWRVVGIELNPLLVLISRLVTWRYRKQVRIIWGDYFRVTWPPADAIYTFMLPRQMAQLDRRIEAWPHKPLKLASFAFRIPGKRPAAQKDGVFLYRYR